MNQLSNRIWLAALLMCFGWVGTAWVRSGYTFEVQPLKRSLESFPTEIIGYNGTDSSLDPEVAAVLNADTTVNRQYVRPDGTSISLSVVGWVRNRASDVAPHNPKICYVNAGWKILEERMLNLTTAHGKLPVCLLFLERDTERCVVAFWYQMGQYTFTTTKEGRKLHRELWGTKKWPATIKFLMQTPSTGLDAALPRVEEFALVVDQWSQEL